MNSNKEYMNTASPMGEEYGAHHFNNWTIAHEATPDAIIDAYLAGKEAGKSHFYSFIKQSFDKNVENALSISEQLYQKLNKEIGLTCKQVFIKPESITDFTALLVVDFDAYLSDFRKKAYSVSRELKKSSLKENEFSINFIFMPDSGTLNSAAIKSDGYAFHYQP